MQSSGTGKSGFQGCVQHRASPLQAIQGVLPGQGFEKLFGADSGPILESALQMVGAEAYFDRKAFKIRLICLVSATQFKALTTVL